MPTVPSSAEERKAVHTTAVFTVQHGAPFEDRVRRNEPSSGKFSFLHGSPVTPYYQWCLSRARQSLGVEDLEREATEALRRGQAQALPPAAGPAGGPPHNSAASTSSAAVDVATDLRDARGLTAGEMVDAAHAMRQRRDYEPLPSRVDGSTLRQLSPRSRKRADREVDDLVHDLGRSRRRARDGGRSR